MDTPLHDLCDTSDLLRCYELCIAYAFNVCVERLRGGAGRLVSSESGRCLSRAARGKDPQLSRGKDLPGAPRRCSARGGLGPPQAAPAPLQNIAVLGGPKGLGTYLAAFAHNEMQRYLPMSMESWDDPPLAVPMPTAPETRPQPSLRVTREGARESSPVGRDTYMNFSGQSHKLDGG
ncbi:unnamed protein product [Durusdinium trenchii]|uniref:Uncharacterized protein n=1 Tax=Durusdinium trenchii TaxID=1381693 RepID=A0ABP0LGT3_9DINO